MLCIEKITWKYGSTHDYEKCTKCFYWKSHNQFSIEKEHEYLKSPSHRTLCSFRMAEQGENLKSEKGTLETFNLQDANVDSVRMTKILYNAGMVAVICKDHVCQVLCLGRIRSTRPLKSFKFCDHGNSEFFKCYLFYVSAANVMMSEISALSQL